MNSYTIKVVLKEPEVEGFDKQILMSMNEDSLYDALALSIAKRAEELYKLGKNVKSATFISSGEEKDGEKFTYQEKLSFKDKAKVGDYDASTEELPFTVDSFGYINPSASERAIIEGLKMAYPDYSFKYIDDSGISVYLLDSWKSIQDYLSRLDGKEKVVLSDGVDYKTAQKFIEETSTLFFKEYGLSLSIKEKQTEADYIYSSGLNKV